MQSGIPASRFVAISSMLQAAAAVVFYDFFVPRAAGLRRGATE